MADVHETWWAGYGASYGSVAQANGFYWCYEEYNGGVRITGFDDGDDDDYSLRPAVYTKNSNGTFSYATGRITIPSTLGGKSVVAIGDRSFYWCSGVTSITIPSTVKSIGYEAFWRCSSLTSITIPSSVTSIASYAFCGCSSLTSVNGGENVTSLNSTAFEGCSKLVGSGMFVWRNFLVDGRRCSGKVEVPSSVARIADDAFNGNEAVEEIRLPANVIAIGNYAFSGCTALSKIVFAGAVPDVGYNVFGYSSSKISPKIFVSPSQPSWSEYLASGKWNGLDVFSSEASIISVWFDANGGSVTDNLVLFAEGVALGTLQTPTRAGYDFLGWWTQKSGGTQISSSTKVPSSEVKYYAHWRKTSIGEAIAQGKYTFTTGESCEWIVEDGVAHSGDRTSGEVPSWMQTTVTGPATVSFKWKEYGWGLDYLYFDIDGKSHRSIESSDWEEVSLEIASGSHVLKWSHEGYSYDNGGFGVGYVKDFTVTARTSDWSFKENEDGTITLTNVIASALGSNVTIPSTVSGKTVTALGDGLFKEAYGIETVTVPSTVKKIGNRAFYGCLSLTSVTLQSGLEEIGNEVFYGCTKLTSIYIPNTVTSLGDYTFQGCTALTSISIPNTVTLLGNYTFQGCKALKTVSLSSGLTALGKGLFKNCTALTVLTIPSRVEDVGEYAFEGCTALASLVFPASITHVGQGAFRDCYAMKKLYITDMAAYCNAKYDVEYRSQEDDDYYDSTPLYYASGATLYLNHQAVTDLVVPEGVSELPYNIFYGLSQITSVTLPSSLRWSSDDAFGGCYAIDKVYVPDVATLLNIKGSARSTYDGYAIGNWLPSQTGNAPLLYVGGVLVNEVVVPDSVTSLAYRSLGYRNIKKVTLPSSLKYLGGALCYSGIERLEMPEGVVQIADHAFYGCNNLRTVILPHSLKTVGDIFYECRGLRRVEFKAANPEIYCGIFSTQGLTNLESVVFHGSAPTVFDYDNYECHTEATLYTRWTDFTVYAERGSTGWGVDIPGTWQGCRIKYISPVHLADYTTGGNVGWKEEDGAFKSGAISHSQSSTLSFTVNGPGVLSFDWKVSSEKYYDKLSIKVSDDQFFSQISSISGEQKWSSVTFTNELSGTHTITWTYAKNSGVSSGEDCAWVRDIYYICNVTFDLGDGTRIGGGEISQEVLFGCLPVAPDVMAPEGHAFVGWDKKILPVTGSLTYTAQYYQHTIADALGSGNMQFINDVSYPWRVVSDEAKVGALALRSGEIANRETSLLKATVNGPGTISFWCKVSSEADEEDVYDGLIFSVDGTKLTPPIGGEIGWTNLTFAVEGTGEHTLKWEYKKDKSDFAGSDCAWLDEVTWTPILKIPDVASDAAVGVVDAAVDKVGFADETVKETIGGNAEAYAAFKNWAEGMEGGVDAVVANKHAAAAYLLGAEALFDSEPEIEIAEVEVGSEVDQTTNEQKGSLTLSVTVKDGENAVAVASEKVKDMFEATSSLGDWDGEAKLTPNVEVLDGEGNTMRFKVTPGDGKSPSAFLRIKR